MRCELMKLGRMTFLVQINFSSNRRKKEHNSILPWERMENLTKDSQLLKNNNLFSSSHSFIRACNTAASVKTLITF